MADRYVVTGRDAAVAASPGTTALEIRGVATTRGRVYEYTISTGGTPADNAIQWLVMRTTTAGTGTAVATIAEVDLDGPAALLTAAENFSIEPAYTAGGELQDNIINQRATYRWVAVPGGELMVPAATGNAIGWRAFHASYTGTAEVTAGWLE